MENEIEFHRAVAHGNISALIKFKQIYSMKELSALANRRHSETAATSLLTACKMGHYKVVKFLLEECTVNIEQTCDGVRLASDSYDEEMTSLHLSVSRGRLNLVELLLSHGAQVNAATKVNKRTPLHIACYNNNIDIVKCLLDHGANIDDTNCCGTSSLMIACEKANIDLVKFLLSANADVHKMSLSKGNTALHKCCKSEYEDIDDIFMLLVQHGASINAKNIYGITPLIKAALKGDKKLIFRMCTANLLTCNQVTEIEGIFDACDLVKRCGNIRKIKCKAKHLVCSTCNDGFLLYDLIFIIFSKMVDHLSVWKQHLADHPNSTNLHILLQELTKVLADTLDLGSFLVHPSNGKGFMDKFRDVLCKLVNLNLRIASGRQPLHLIMAQMKTIGHNPLILRNELSCLPLIKELLKVGADPNGRDEDGNTPLHLAAMMRSKIKHKQHFEVLIASGARTCASNHNGETFLDLLPSGEADHFRIEFCSGEKMELACLASRVIKKSKIPFEMLPAKVVEYVHRH